MLGPMFEVHAALINVVNYVLEDEPENETTQRVLQLLEHGNGVARDDVRAIITSLYGDEEADYLAQDAPANHIFTDISKVNEWLNTPVSA